MVRVAVEAVHQQDMDKLELGLSRLYQADPAVEVGASRARGLVFLVCFHGLLCRRSGGEGGRVRGCVLG